MNTFQIQEIDVANSRVLQSTLDEECYTLIESRERLETLIHNHYSVYRSWT